MRSLPAAAPPPELENAVLSSHRQSEDNRPSGLSVAQAGAETAAGSGSTAVCQSALKPCVERGNSRGINLTAGSYTSTCPVSGGAAAESSELEDLLRGYPLVQAATKARVREVLSALRSRHEEKRDDWRREAQAAVGGANSQVQIKAGEVSSK